MMQGRWLGGCEAESDGTGYGLTTEYKDTEIAVWGGQFGDSTCSSLIFEVGLIGKYSLGSTLITENGTAATELDYVVNQLVMRPSSHDFATKMNQTSYCGLTNWSAGVSQEITGCSEFKPASKNYDLVQFDGSAHFLGARSGSRDASSKDKRPTTIDYSTKFVRASANDPIHQDDSSNAISRGTSRELLELYLKKLRMFNWGGFGLSNR